MVVLIDTGHLLMCSVSMTLALTVARTQDIQCTSQPPVDDDDNLVIPLDGFAHYTCETRIYTNWSMKDWYLIGTIFAQAKGIQKFERNNVTCILLRNTSICDRVTFQFSPTTAGLDGNQTKVCRLLINSAGVNISPDRKCNSKSFTIKIFKLILEEPPPGEATVLVQALSPPLAFFGFSFTVLLIATAILTFLWHNTRRQRNESRRDARANLRRYEAAQRVIRDMERF